MPLGPMELFLIFMIFVLLFGSKKLPQLGEGIGKALKNFKQSVNDIEENNKDIKNKALK